VDRVLGGIVMDGKIGRTPRRLEITSQSRQSLIGYAGPGHGKPELNSVVTPDAPADPIGSLPIVSRGKARSKTHDRRANTGTAFLRLVVNND